MAATMTRSKPVTLHDTDYLRVAQAIQRARAKMRPTQVIEDIICPICGGEAWVLPPGDNTGLFVVAMCETGCFTCWE